MFIGLLGFSGPLATKYESLNNEPCMIRPTLIYFNPFESNYYPFMISLDKCNGSCKAFDGLSPNGSCKAAEGLSPKFCRSSKEET